MSKFTVVYAQKPRPHGFAKSIFLAGPTPRDRTTPSWRPEALSILETLGFDGVVFVPEEESYGSLKPGFEYATQIEWESMGLNTADIIVFWIPRDMEKMPALTTNDEFGFWKSSGKVVLGFPPTAFRVGYQKFYAEKLGFPAKSTLRDTMEEAVLRIGDGAWREGGEVEVPLHIWKTPSFQSWYESQRKVGNELRHARVLWTFQAGRNPAFFFALHVDVFIKEENRNKTNEVVIARPDVCSVVLYKRGNTFEDTKVVLVKEFRSPVNNDSGYVWEIPGGSSWNSTASHEQIAIEEVHEEVGLSLTRERLRSHHSRQIAATMSAHKSHLFSAEITDAELQWLIAKQSSGHAHGVAEDTERTYVQVQTIRDIMKQNLMDWSCLGMVLSVLHE